MNMYVCIYTHLYIYIYRYICVSPQKVPTAVGVDVLDLTHLNFRMFVFG